MCYGNLYSSCISLPCVKFRRFLSEFSTYLNQLKPLLKLIIFSGLTAAYYILDLFANYNSRSS